MLENPQANTAYNKESVRKVRHFYVMIRDADDGEVRVTRLTDAKKYDGIGVDVRPTAYFGKWSILHKSQDRAKLLKYAALMTNDKAAEVQDRDAADRSYAQFLPEEHKNREG
jgi:hypothetical protein